MNRYYRWGAMVLILLFLIYKFVDKYSLIRVIQQALPFKEAALLTGMILGEKGNFDFKFYQDLKNTGIVHLVVVSGSNIMLIARMWIENLARYWGRKEAIISGLVIIWGYAALSNWEIPVIRAVLLVTVFYWAQFLGRKFDVFRGLGLVAAIMLIADYRMVLSISFWLSFLAFLGVIIKPVWEGRIKSYWLKELSRTVWVSLWITPVLAFAFGKISIVSPVCNLLVMALTEMIMIFGVLGLVVYQAIPVLGQWILWLCYPLLKYVIVVAELFGNYQFSSISLNFNIVAVLGWYLVLSGALLKKYGHK